MSSSSKDFLGDRKKALEDSFFDKENRRLLEEMRAEEIKKEARQSLAEVSGLSDDATLDKLTELGIGGDTWAALSLVPLVEVAWADGVLEEKERRAVLSAAEANGIGTGSPSHALLNTWLAERPDPRLLEAWGEYIVAVCAELDEAERESLQREILGRAQAVADAAGGILGLVNRVSAREQAVLAELQKPFEK